MLTLFRPGKDLVSSFPETNINTFTILLLLQHVEEGKAKDDADVGQTLTTPVTSPLFLDKLTFSCFFFFWVNTTMVKAPFVATLREFLIKKFCI